MEYMESEEFKEMYKERYKIEGKNGELKMYMIMEKVMPVEQAA